MDEQDDVIVQGPLEIEIRGDGTVVWIHTRQGTILRACRISDLRVVDHRSPGLKIKQDLSFAELGVKPEHNPKKTHG